MPQKGGLQHVDLVSLEINYGSHSPVFSLVNSLYGMENVLQLCNYFPLYAQTLNKLTSCSTAKKNMRMCHRPHGSASAFLCK